MKYFFIGLLSIMFLSGCIFGASGYRNDAIDIYEEMGTAIDTQVQDVIAETNKEKAEQKQLKLVNIIRKSGEETVELGAYNEDTEVQIALAEYIQSADVYFSGHFKVLIEYKQSDDIDPLDLYTAMKTMEEEMKNITEKKEHFKEVLYEFEKTNGLIK